MLFFTRCTLLKYYPEKWGFVPEAPLSQKRPKATRKLLRVFCLWPSKSGDRAVLSRNTLGQRRFWDSFWDTLSYCFFFILILLSQCPRKYKNKRRKKEIKKRRQKFNLFWLSQFCFWDGTLGQDPSFGKDTKKITSWVGVAP